MRFLRFIKKLFIISFTLIGVVFVGVFLTMKFGVFNVRGSIEDRNKFFTETDQNKILRNQNVDKQRAIVICESKAISKYAQNLGDDIILVWYKKNKIDLTRSMINNAIAQIASSNPEIRKDIDDCSKIIENSITEKSIYPWANTPDWDVISNGLIKDASIINQVAEETNVPARLIISAVIPEQFRFFSANRESYKKYFEPLKILGTLSKFSLGVSGIKPDTANQIENNDLTPTSPFYLGPEYEHLLDYPPGVNHNTELYNRLTDSKNHYYQYLYTALFIKQIETQWQGAGFDLSFRPDVLSTIFNLGYYHSKPNDTPEAGGAVIKVGDGTISFGELGSEFYFSGELIDIFSY